MLSSVDSGSASIVGRPSAGRGSSCTGDGTAGGILW